MQANLHHAVAATAVLERCLAQDNIDLALIQEPWVVNGEVRGLGATGKLLVNKDGTRPRACIVFDKCVNFLPVPELCSDDLVAAFANIRGWVGARVIICSAYLPSERADPTEDLGRVVEYARRNQAELLVGCDANAHHTSWGSSDINSRGELLFDFLISNHLTTLNVGRTPTFVTSNRQEVLDITFASNNLARHIEAWRVSEEISMSDHRHIRFDIRATLTYQKEVYRDPKCTAWEVYKDRLKQYLDNTPKYIKSVEGLELAVETVTVGIHMAFEESCPVKTKTSKRKVPWWNSKLRKLREKTRKLFNRAKKTQEWEVYRKALTNYNKEIRKAKRASWRKLCEEIEHLPQCARLHKILSKTSSAEIGLLKTPNGTYTTNEIETLELLAATHFPGSLREPGSVCSGSGRRTRNEDWRMAARIIRPGVVKWAVSTFKSFKSGGEDGIIPILLQNGVDILYPHLVNIFRASYALGYIPERWTTVKVLFIPKAGKKDYSMPKSFRPISLTSFLLKTMEKVIDRYIRDEALNLMPIHHTQHAYRRGKSTETALVSLVDRIEKALEDKEIALCAFLDVEGAFDNSPTSLLVEGLVAKKVDDTTTRWVNAMLSNRRVKITLLNSSVEVLTTRGCPQGGVLSPLLWTLAVDKLLRLLSDQRIEVQGYADDLVIMVRGFCQSTLSCLLQNALSVVGKWCKDNNLNVNADKTVVIPFTNKRKLDKLAPPRLNGKEITFSSEVKYLGVTLDQRLNWTTHLNNTLLKAKMSLGMCSRIAGKSWGLKPRMVLWLYTAIVRPTVTYASLVWNKKVKEVTTAIKLSRLQRTACLMATGAMSTSPGVALNGLLGLTPLELHIDKEAKASMYRVNSLGMTKWQSVRMRSLVNSFESHEVLSMTSDNMLPQYSFEKRYHVEIPLREDWLEGQIACKEGSLIWFTDGSKMGPDVGLGVYGERPRFRLSKSLGSHASIFQAELLAIIECVEANLRKNYTNHTIYINVDSQAALLALRSNVVTSKLVANCLNRLNTLGLSNRVILRWVPGHEGIIGNEKADELAREGAKGKLYGPEPYCGIPKSLARRCLEEEVKIRATEAWTNTPGLKHSKALIRPYEAKRSKELIGLSRNKLRLVVRALTGHCRLNKHMANIGLSDSKMCRFCSEEEETPLHIITECGPLMHKRSSILGLHLLSPEEAQLLTPKDLIRFLVDIGLEGEL